MPKPQGQKKKTLPKNFQDLVLEGDIEKLKKVFDTCSVNAKGTYDKSVALSFYHISNKLIYWLIKSGADIEAVNIYQKTSLHSHASRLSGDDAVHTLLKLGARATTVDEDGNTPLHAAIGIGNIKTVKYLIKYGAQINALNKNQETPLEYGLIHSGNIIALLKLSQLILSLNGKITKKMQNAIKRIGEGFERYRSSLDKYTFQKRNKALQNLYKIYDVTPVKKRTLHDGTSPIHIDGKTWQKQFENLWDLLVPGSGPAKTQQGEVVRISGKVRGEILDNGGGNRDNDFRKIIDAFLMYISSHNHLSDDDLQKAKVIIKEIRKNGEGDDDDINFLCELATKWVGLNPNPIKLQKISYRI